MIIFKAQTEISPKINRKSAARRITNKKLFE